MTGIRIILPEVVQMDLASDCFNLYDNREMQTCPMSQHKKAKEVVQIHLFKTILNP